MLSDNRQWWSIPELAEELPMGEKLIRKLASNGCFGPPFQPGGKGGKMWFHGDNVEAFISENMEQNAKELELSTR